MRFFGRTLTTLSLARPAVLRSSLPVQMRGFDVPETLYYPTYDKKRIGNQAFESQDQVQKYIKTVATDRYKEKNGREPSQKELQEYMEGWGCEEEKVK